MDVTNNVLAQRLSEARRRVGLTQAQLAAAAGFAAPQMISQIEKGERDVKAWELAKLAGALAVNLYDLLKTEQAAQPVVVWRRAPQENAAIKEARFIERYQRFCFVQRVTGSQPRILPERINVSIRDLDRSLAARYGEQTRESFKLGARPALALARVAESIYGIQIWYAHLGDDGSAASIVDQDGAAILLNSDESPRRRNFSLAHEIFHVLTWDAAQLGAIRASEALSGHNERMADVFASNLLLPAEQVAADVRRATSDGKVAFVNLVAIARDFGVSTDALVWRLVSLGLLPRAAAKDMLNNAALRAIDSSARQQDWQQPPDLSERYVHLCWLAWQQGHLSRGRLADYLETDLADLDRQLAFYGLSEDEPLAADGGDVTIAVTADSMVEDGIDAAYPA